MQGQPPKPEFQEAATPRVPPDIESLTLNPPPYMHPNNSNPPRKTFLSRSRSLLYLLVDPADPPAANSSGTSGQKSAACRSASSRVQGFYWHGLCRGLNALDSQVYGLSVDVVVNLDPDP